jgi:beta-glucosidase
MSLENVQELISSLTLDEKIGQLSMAAAGFARTGPVVTENVEESVRSGKIGSVINIWGVEATRAIQQIAMEQTRHKIPLLLTFDVIHGHKTIFPIPLAEAASFDPSLWERTAQAQASEAAEDGISLTFAPMIDVARDIRWGRIAEGPGEDPWLASSFARAKIRGLQGSNLSARGSIAATAKHFCAYGACLAGRDYASTDVSTRTLHEVYLPPFEAAISAGCAAVMPAFSDLAGIPMTANAPLLEGCLRDQLGFKGVIISDYNAIPELINHGIASDVVNAAALALLAGVDIDLMGNAYAVGLPIALERGLITIHHIDRSVRRVLELKEQLGLFTDPYCRGSSSTTSDRAYRRQLSREAGCRAIVLLTNSNILPLSPKVKHIALVGPLGNAGAEMRGPWYAAGEPADPVTILEGLRAGLPDCEITFAAGVGIEGDDTSGIPSALDACRQADVVLLSIGESADMSGEAASRANPGLPGRQAELADAVLDVGKPVVAIISSGRPLTMPGLIERAQAVVATWFLGSEAGNAIADVIRGVYNPTGRLPVTWPRHVGQVPIYFSQRLTGRPYSSSEHYTSKYIDLPVDPIFYFGHGMAYCDFAISDIRTNGTRFTAQDTIDIEAEVINHGAVFGEETVFLFARDEVASVAQPRFELKGVAKIALGPDQSGSVKFRLPTKELSICDTNLHFVLEPGNFRLFIGQSADPDRLLSTTVCVV